MDEVLALNFIQIGQFMRVMKERLGLPDVLAAPAAAPAVAAPGAAGAAGAEAGNAAAAGGEKKEEKKEKKTASVKLVKYDAKDKIKVETGW